MKANSKAKLVTLSLTLALSMTFILSGCGASSNSNASPKPNDSTSATTSDSSTAPSPSAKIKIVAAENFLGEVATAVGGDRVNVTSIINNPDTDPHSFEPTADTSKAVSDAQLVVYTGIGYDEWIQKLIQASSSSKTLIAVGSDLLEKKDGDNPHVWYDPTSMPKLADALADKLAKLDPGQAEAFKKRALDYKASLAPLQDLVQKLKQSSPTDIAVSEPVFAYMAEALNLKVVNPSFAKAVEEETDPAAADIADLQNQIKGKKIKAFVQNTQVDNPTVKNMVDLVTANQIPVVHVTETEPQGKNYLQWMSEELNELKKGLDVK
ncbi:zinc ABC transporter substrate-binding protein [Paenibacillus filicis]|uniref:Zinc ABC transporter substrate-binding protein n=1 Tax=Paenibacillus gyeongsangnamensis TaxID=3388067 RepID=A0ABT4QDS4_9BACL|nr:zinc ABC transporter substrate-binding protein [Paenibacillus filicis]MCZ8515036.1 zinc ABC transporter substrate-binding protein [Paenibacillus filicis]